MPGCRQWKGQNSSLRAEQGLYYVRQRKEAPETEKCGGISELEKGNGGDWQGG